MANGWHVWVRMKKSEPVWCATETCEKEEKEERKCENAILY